MKFALVSALLATVSGQFISDPRIVGGYEVSPQFKYPFMVSLEVNGRHLCAGTIYKKDVVITAAHCLIYDDSDWTIVQHRHDLAKTDAQESGKRFKVIKRVRHPEFDHSMFDLNDVSLWKIKGDFKLPSYDVLIDDGTYGNSTDKMLTTLGWGATAFQGASSPKLMELKVPTYNIDRCVKSYDSVNKIVNKTAMFCAGFPEGGKDACQGDSGGPIFITKNKQTVLTGITSWGHGCAQPEFPGVYTRLYKYLNFIKQKF